MNTRRKMVSSKKEDHPSTTFHLLHDTYHPLFQSSSIQQVEEWYNLGASGTQREFFRTVCKEIYAMNPNQPPPAFPSVTEATMREEESKLMIKTYAEVLSEEGKAKARVWILAQDSKRRRDQFREVFLACKTHVPPKSVLKTDYTAPDEEHYRIDRTNFQHSVDWNNLKDRQSAQALQREREEKGLTTNFDSTNKRPSQVVEQQRRAEHPTARVTKPKNQFDGVNHLKALGYEGVDSEEAIAALKAQHERSAEGEQYSIDPKTGATVYKAGGKNLKTKATQGDPHLLESYHSEPMTQWNVKTL